MKRSIIFFITLVASSFLVSLAGSDSEAQPQKKTFVWDTGVIALGPNQRLRLAVTGDGQLLGNLLLRFRRTGYFEADNIYQVASQTTTGPVSLGAGEAVSVDFNRDGADAVRGMVLSNRRNVRVTATIMNTITGETTSHIIMANTEGDFH